VRLALEEAGSEYVDIALRPEKEGGGVPAIEKFLEGPDVVRPPFAPPFLKAGRQLIGQTANILLFLGPRLGLAPRDTAGKLWAHQLQLTIADFVTEIHDTHHPIGGELYYEDQKQEAKRRAGNFIAQRLPKFIGYFERVLKRNPSSDEWMVGAALTYVDLSMAQIIVGLRTLFLWPPGRSSVAAPDCRRSTTRYLPAPASRPTAHRGGDSPSTTRTFFATIGSWVVFQLC
jgi:glutathione S-transferase